jgi:DNA polymerase III alpha subunit
MGLFGILDFYNAMRAKGLKPIIGCEVYVAPRAACWTRSPALTMSRLT